MAAAKRVVAREMTSRTRSISWLIWGSEVELGGGGVTKGMEVLARRVDVVVRRKVRMEEGQSGGE